MIKKTTFSVFNLINSIFMAIIMLLMTYPFIYVALYSISDPAKVSNGFLLFPAGLNFDSYKTVWRETELPSAILISILRSTIGPLLTLLFSSMVAFVLTKRYLVGRKFFMMFFVFTLYFNSGIIPLYFLYKNLHLTGTFAVYILPYLIGVFNMLLIKTFMEGLPEELFDSSKIDGADDLQVYLRIVLPLCKPVLSAIFLFECVNQWNMFFDTLIFNTMQPKLYTLQYVLVNFVQSKATQIFLLQGMQTAGVTPVSLKMAITVIVILPIIPVYAYIQRHLVKGLLLGAIKG